MARENLLEHLRHAVIRKKNYRQICVKEGSVQSEFFVTPARSYNILKDFEDFQNLPEFYLNRISLISSVDQGHFKIFFICNFMLISF